ALQQLVDRGAHRALDDVDEVLGVDLRVGADEERPLAALVVGRERDELEDALDVSVAEPGLEQTLSRRAAHEALRAGAGVDAPGFDADDTPDAVRGSGRDPDQRRDLLRLEVADRRSALERVLRSN